MFVRMLKLPDEVRLAHDLSIAPSRDPRGRSVPGRGEAAHHRVVGSDPPRVLRGHRGQRRHVHRERGLAAASRVRSGRVAIGKLHIVDEEGNDLPPNTEGTIYFSGGGEFEYHNAPEKTEGARLTGGRSTLGDVGYVDDDGYLFLTDRKAYMIISGGVNIYPREIEDVIVTHPKVADVAVFGIPDDDFGEQVKAVVQTDRRRRAI